MSNDRVSVFSTENRAEVPIYPLDVFVLTESGMDQIHGGSTRLRIEALEVMVMVDGKRTVGDLEQAMPHIPPANLRNVLRFLLAANFARPRTLAEAGGVDVDFDAFFKSAGSAPPASGGAEKSADREAVYGAPDLQRNGYYVSIARQAIKPRPPAGGAKRQVLLIEDDAETAAIIQRLLERDGFAVLVCAKRDAVLARLRQTPSPDAVVLDLQLEELNGLEVLQKLKAHPQLKLMPVIVVTADAKPESVMRGLALGADGYVTKPFDHVTLVKGVRAVMGI